MSLQATIKAFIQANHLRTADNSSGKAKLELSRTFELTDGVDAGEADLIFQDTRTLSASASESLDLAGGSLVDSFGQAVTFAKIVAVIVVASPANNIANEVQVTRPASNGVPLFIAAGDGISLAPGAFVAWGDGVTGKTVTAGTGDLLTVTNSAGTNSVTYSIIIVGKSA